VSHNPQFPLKDSTASGTQIIIQRNEMQGTALLVVIPSKRYDFDLRPVVEELQKIADSERINIALQEVQGLEGP